MHSNEQAIVDGDEPRAWEFGYAQGLGTMRIEAKDETCWPPRTLRYYWTVLFHGTVIHGHHGGYPSYEQAKSRGLEAFRAVRALATLGFVGSAGSPVSHGSIRDEE